MGLSPEFLVRSVSLLPLGGFSLNFGQMFTYGTMCRTHKTQPWGLKDSHSLRSRVWALNFVSTCYLLYPWKDFLLILVKCLPQWNDVQNHSLTMQTHKVTVQGHEFEPWISCSLHISWTLWKIFIIYIFGSNVCLSEMCRTHNSTIQTQGQGHNWRPPVWALNFEAAPLSFYTGDIAVLQTALFSLVILSSSSPMSCIFVTVDANHYSPPNIVSTPYLLNHWNVFFLQLPCLLKQAHIQNPSVSDVRSRSRSYLEIV